MRNPYTLVFGKEPLQRISRSSQQIEIVDSFREEPPLQQIYMITGVRGAGKTVFMTEIANEIGDDKDWIVVELNGSGDLLGDLAASLASDVMKYYFDLEDKDVLINGIANVDENLEVIED